MPTTNAKDNTTSIAANTLIVYGKEVNADIVLRILELKEDWIDPRCFAHRTPGWVHGKPKWLLEWKPKHAYSHEMRTAICAACERHLFEGYGADDE